MNTCYDKHTPKYKIKYKPSRSGSQSSIWLVCERCFGKPEFFGSINEIESIISLERSQEIKFQIEHISLMTEKIGEKIQKHLRVYRR